MAVVVLCPLAPFAFLGEFAFLSLDGGGAEEEDGTAAWRGARSLPLHLISSHLILVFCNRNRMRGRICNKLDLVAHRMEQDQFSPLRLRAAPFLP
jgi:hypothetical protein